MKGGTGEQRLQKSKLISTGYLSRNKSVWRFQGARQFELNGFEARSESVVMAVAQAVPRPSVLKESRGSWAHREHRGQDVHEASEDDHADDSEAETECHGCRKIKDEGRKPSPSNGVSASKDKGESKVTMSEAPSHQVIHPTFPTCRDPTATVPSMRWLPSCEST